MLLATKELDGSKDQILSDDIHRSSGITTIHHELFISWFLEVGHIKVISANVHSTVYIV